MSESLLGSSKESCATTPVASTDKEKVNHEIWFSPITNHYFVVDQQIKSHTANTVLKQAGIPKRF